MKSLSRSLHRGLISGAALAACFSILIFVSSTNAHAVNPVPYLAQPLVPDATAPGGPGFTLTVNGTGFVSGSVVRWNGSARATHFVSQGRLTATIAATDVATASTAAVTVVNPSPGGGASNPAYFPIAVPEASVSFARTDFSSGGWNVNLVTADFNGDAKLDLATTDYTGSLVRIFLGNGDGTFRVGQTYAGCDAHGSAVGDFNGDGLVDLVIADGGCGKVTILLGNGDGTFREGGNFSTGGAAAFAPYSVAVGDFNRDGKLDLVTASESNIVSVLLGNGDGTFQEHVDYDLVGQNALHVAVGDFNGDGYLDVAVASSMQDAVTILLGNGDGTFRTGPIISLATTDNRSVTAADLNGDGKLDLVIRSSYGGTLDVMLGNGDGTFHSGWQYTESSAGSVVGDNVAAADFNGDGILDLAVPIWASSFALLLGNGNGTFQAPVNYPAGDGARGIAVGDFNGDGRLDAAVGNQFGDSISIFLQTSGDTITLSPSSLNFGNQLLNTTSPPQTLTLTNTGEATLNISSIVASANFSQTNDCGSSVLAGASCTIAVTFKPTKTSTCAETGTLTITDDASGSPQTVKLSGAGTVITLSVWSLNFGNQPVGTTSSAKTITLTNHSTSRAVSIPAISISGLNSPAFAQTNTCGTSLAAGASCTLSVTFTPHGNGSKTATLNLWDNGGGGPHRVTLSGNGT